MNTFAFIEFKYAEDAASAADSEVSTIPTAGSLAHTDTFTAIRPWPEDPCREEAICQTSGRPCRSCCRPRPCSIAHTSNPAVHRDSMQQWRQHGIPSVSCPSKLPRRTATILLPGLPYDATYTRIYGQSLPIHHTSPNRSTHARPSSPTRADTILPRPSPRPFRLSRPSQLLTDSCQLWGNERNC